MYIIDTPYRILISRKLIDRFVLNATVDFALKDKACGLLKMILE
jgi:hypothetical protein